MQRLTTVLKTTFLGFILLDLLLSIIAYIDSLIDGTKMDLEYLFFVSIYGIIVSIIFGFMDRPKLEKQLLIGISIGAVIVLITAFSMGNEVLAMQSLYVFLGVVIGRRMVGLVDLVLKKASK